MTTELARQSLAVQLWGDRLQVVKESFAKGLTDAELEVFAAVCERSKLDPFARPAQIYPIKRYDSKAKKEVLVIQGAIDGFRLIAARTREFGGSVVEWCGKDGVWRDVWLEDTPPAAARCKVWRKGHMQPTEGIALWKETAQYFKTDRGTELSAFWQRMPAHMLAKCAETDALKKAFPQDTLGLELDIIAGEREASRQQQAARYTQIYGDEDRKDRFDAPASPMLADTVTVDADTGEVVDEVDLWAENRRLVAEARKRGVHGAPLVANAGGSIQQVNAELAERIRNYDLDQQALAESQR